MTTKHGGSSTPRRHTVIFWASSSACGLHENDGYGLLSPSCVLITVFPLLWTTMLYTSYMKAVQSKKLFVPKLPAVDSGTSTAIRRSICLGFVNRVVQGTREPEMALLALACFRSELTAAGWGVGLLRQAVNDVVIKSGRSGEVRSEVLAMLATVVS